jgi:hypothetical protein
MNGDVDNPFDPERLKLPADLVPERKVSLSRKEKKRKGGFVVVPGLWQERLTKARNVATYRMALLVLRQSWENNGKPFTLSNGALKMENITRWQKWRALAELERFELVAVERRERKSPTITALHTVRT